MEEKKDSAWKKVDERDNDKPKQGGKVPGNKRPRFNAVWIYALIGFTIVLIYIFDRKNPYIFSLKAELLWESYVK